MNINTTSSIRGKTPPVVITPTPAPTPAPVPAPTPEA